MSAYMFFPTHFKVSITLFLSIIILLFLTKEHTFSLLYETGGFNTTTTMKDCTTDKSLFLEIFISCGKPMLTPKNIEHFENQYCHSVVL